MPYRISCPTCKTVCLVPDDSLGKKMLCSKCRHPFSVGNPKPAAPAASKPPQRPPSQAAAGRTTTDLPLQPPSKAPSRRNAIQSAAPPAVPPTPRKKSPLLIVGLLAAVLFVLGGAVVGAIVAGSYFLKPRTETPIVQAPSADNKQPAQTESAKETTQPPTDPKTSPPAKTEEPTKPKSEPEPSTSAPKSDKPSSPPPPSAEPPPAADPPVSNRDQLPRTAEVGKPFRYQLSRPGDKVRQYSLYSGPKGLKISKEGLLEWTPEPGQAGSHRIFVGVVTAKLSATDLYTIVVRGTGEAEPPKGDPIASRPPRRNPPGGPQTPSNLPPATTVPSGTASEFQVLATDAPATTLEVSEDGQLLFTAHMEKNRVTVWDVKTAKAIKTLECAAPQCLLFRSGKLYAGSHDKPALFVFDQAADWSLADELKTSGCPVAWLAAPRGESFNGRIIVTVAAVNIQAATRGERANCMVDTKKDQPQRIPGSAVTTVDPTGRYALIHDDFGWGFMGRKSAVDYLNLVEGRRIDIGVAGEDRFLFAGPHEGYWFGVGEVWQGMPPAPDLKQPNTTAVPDQTRKLVYLIEERAIRARLLAPDYPETGARPVRFPAAYKGGGFSGDQRNARFVRPIAVTLDGQLHVYLLAQESKKVFHLHMPAFEEKAIPPTDAPLNGLLARAVEDKEFSHQLPADGRTYTLLSGPKGLALSPQGALTWRPGKDAIGTHEIKARVVKDGKTAIERHTIEVLDKELVAGSGGDPSRADNFTGVPLRQQNHQLLWSADRAHLLLLQGRTLQVLTPDGRQITATHTLEQYCERIAERADSYVALGGMEMYLLDKTTLKVHKTISLAKYRQIHDFAVHPKKKITFVSVKNTVAKVMDEPAEALRIVRVNEENGESTELPRIYGRWIAIDPEGKYLIAAYKDVFKTGEHYHLNPDWNVITIPEYGNIDMLMRYNLAGDAPHLEEVLRKAGGNGQRLVLSPDGKQAAYLSFVGYPDFSRNIAAFDVTNLKKEAVTYRTKDRADCKRLVYHPVLDLVASPGSGSAVLYNRRTGEEEANRLKLTSKGLGKAQVDELTFSADGKYLIFAVTEVGRGRYLRSVPLNLTTAELNDLRK